MRRGEPFYQEEAEGEMLAFLSKIARENGNIQGGGSVNMREKAKISNLVSRSLDYISDHYREQIKVGDIAKRLHLSETHFRRVFTQYMGVSPLEYINIVRIRSACEYLIKTDDSIAAIAEKCGYYTSSTFNRNFHKTVGMTPEEWRKKPEILNGSCWNSTYIQRRDGSMYAIRITEQVTRKKRRGQVF